MVLILTLALQPSVLTFIQQRLSLTLCLQGINHHYIFEKIVHFLPLFFYPSVQWSMYYLNSLKIFTLLDQPEDTYWSSFICYPYRAIWNFTLVYFLTHQYPGLMMLRSHVSGLLYITFRNIWVAVIVFWFWHRCFKAYFENISTENAMLSYILLKFYSNFKSWTINWTNQFLFVLQQY